MTDKIVFCYKMLDLEHNDVKVVFRWVSRCWLVEWCLLMHWSWFL